MKLIKSDGRTLSVWDIGDVLIYELPAGAYRGSEVLCSITPAKPLWAVHRV
jgi:hypothetical protein